MGRKERKQLSEALRRGREVRLRLSSEDMASLEAPWISPMVDVHPTGVQTLDARWHQWSAPGLRTEAGPSVTVVIPTHRGLSMGAAPWTSQDLPVRVLVLSNGPQGPTEEAGAEVIRVAWEGHGATRQAAVDRIEDDYTLFTVDDALPLGRGFVRLLVQSLESSVDGRPWDAMIARQLPWPDADPVTVARLRDWTPPAPGAYRVSQADHVATLYRTADLRKNPLPAVPIAEDAWWSRDRRVGCEPSAPVVHSHARHPLALYRRNRDIHRERVRMGEPATVESLGALLGAVPSTLRPLLRGQARESLNQLAELVGQFQGSR